MSYPDPQYCTVLCTKTFGVIKTKNTKPFIHLSLCKAGPFTLESDIHVKALKRKVSQEI